MKDMERYIGATYINSYQPDIMTETPETFSNPEMTKIIPGTGVKHPNTDA